MDQARIEANVTLEQALRRANLLSAAAEVSQNITRIMDIDELLPKTVDIICEAYNFYYSGVFLIDASGEFAVLRAGRGEPGRIMMDNKHKLAVGGNSMIGACTALNEARISLDVDTEKVWYPNPVLPATRSEMALPLAIGDRVIGAVTVQSVEAAAFSDEDISSLQAMANQLAIALDNARQRRELEETHMALVRAKTYEAIATATGDAIHWIGNKAEPIGTTVQRLRTDVQLLVLIIGEVLGQAHLAEVVTDHALAQLLLKEATSIQQSNPNLMQEVAPITKLSLSTLEKRLSLNSILEDLDIIEDAARLIMKVKEDYIGPAREQAPRPTMIDDVIKDAVNSLDLPPGIINIESEKNLPLVLADPVQLNRVAVNLIKNAYEAMEQQSDPKIQLTLRPDPAPNFVQFDVSDNGSGIAENDLDKIWITFHSTKGIKAHPGLGLPACRLILEQMGGSISVTSQSGQGTIFSVKVPVDTGKRVKSKGKAGKSKILVIDDNDSWRQFAVNALEAVGYRVTLADNKYRVNNYGPFDLILLDDVLAENDSLNVLNTVKMAGKISKTIVVSSNPRVEGTKERMLLGIHNLLPKPYTQMSLLHEIKTALSSISKQSGKARR